MEWIDIYIYIYGTHNTGRGCGVKWMRYRPRYVGVDICWYYSAAWVFTLWQDYFIAHTPTLSKTNERTKKKNRISLETLNALECRLTGFEMGEINPRGSSSIRWSFDKRSSTFGMYLCLSVEGNFFCGHVARPTCCQTSNAGQHAWFSVADGKDDKVLDFRDAKLNCVVHNSLGGAWKVLLKKCPFPPAWGTNFSASKNLCIRSWHVQIRGVKPHRYPQTSWAFLVLKGVQCGGGQALASKSSRNSLCMGTRPSCLMLQKCWTARAAVWRRSGRVMISLPARRVSSGWWVAS